MAERMSPSCKIDALSSARLGICGCSEASPPHPHSTGAGLGVGTQPAFW